MQNQSSKFKAQSYVTSLAKGSNFLISRIQFPKYVGRLSTFCLVLLQILFLPVCGWGETLFTTVASQATQPALITEAKETASLVSSILKVVGSLALVIGLMLLLLLLLKKIGLGKGNLKHGPLVKILDTCMIAPKKQVTLLEIGGEYVAVGVTDQQISLLTKLEDKTKLTEAIKKKDSGIELSTNSSPFEDVFNKTVHILKNKNQNSS